MSRRTARALRSAGTQILAITSPGAFDLASSDEDAFFGIEPAHRRMVGQPGRTHAVAHQTDGPVLAGQLTHHHRRLNNAFSRCPICFTSY